jgi:hypothetical protein
MTCATCPHDCEHADIQEAFPAAPTLESRAGQYTKLLGWPHFRMRTDERGRMGERAYKIGREIGATLVGVIVVAVMVLAVLALVCAAIALVCIGLWAVFR